LDPSDKFVSVLQGMSSLNMVQIYG
jgi:hypothetical protein